MIIDQLFDLFGGLVVKWGRAGFGGGGGRLASSV